MMNVKGDDILIDKKLLEVPKAGRKKKRVSDDDLLKLLEMRQIMNSDQIGKSLGVSRATVNRRLREARERYATKATE